MTKKHTPTTNVILWDSVDRDFKLRLAATQLSAKMQARFGLFCHFRNKSPSYHISIHSEPDMGIKYGMQFDIQRFEMGRKGSYYTDNLVEGTDIAALYGLGKLRSSFMPNVLSQRAKELATQFVKRSSFAGHHPPRTSDFVDSIHRAVEATGDSVENLVRDNTFSFGDLGWRPALTFSHGGIYLKTVPPSMLRKFIELLRSEGEASRERTELSDTTGKRFCLEVYNYLACGSTEWPEWYIDTLQQTVNALGTDEEKQHLSWVSSQREKIQDFRTNQLPALKSKLGIIP